MEQTQAVLQAVKWDFMRRVENVRTKFNKSYQERDRGGIRT